MTSDDIIATRHDQTRHDATGPDHDYTLTIDEVAERYAAAGLPRTPRTIQRYCAKGDLDARKVTTTMGDKYLVASYSVARHIGQITEVIAFTQSLGQHDTSRPDATAHDLTGHVTTHRDEQSDPAPQSAAKVEPADTRYVNLLENENNFLREQIGIKDGQIKELSERSRETNFLIKGLQDLFLALQPARKEATREQVPAAAPQSYQASPPAEEGK